MRELSEIIVPSEDLVADIAAFEARGFRLDVISPADDPRTAVLSGHGLTLRLDTRAEVTRPPTAEATFADRFVHTRGGDWGDGRASMQYRDLIPDRHGGHVIASHIRIPEAGPVPDYVHHHDIAFQIIFVRHGRVQVIYEDQGDAFWMEEGDVVLQPPHIRHRVLASDDALEVIEVASPAEHPTFVEHELTLPTASVDRQRDFGGQRFCFDRAEAAAWHPLGDRWEHRDCGIGEATNGVGSVRVLRPVDRQGTVREAHNGTLCLLFLLAGACTLDVDTTSAAHQLADADAVAVPAGSTWTLRDAEPGTTVLHVAMA